MKLLVTGGAGYIGSIVALQLAEAGHDVVVLDDLSKGHEAAVLKDAEFIRADLLDAEKLAEVLAGGYATGSCTSQPCLWSVSPSNSRGGTTAPTASAS